MYFSDSRMLKISCALVRVRGWPTPLRIVVALESRIYCMGRFYFSAYAYLPRGIYRFYAPVSQIRVFRYGSRLHL